MYLQDSLLHGVITRGNRQTANIYVITLYRLAETILIIVVDGFIYFCAHFKYIGSWLSFFLRYDYDVGRRIDMANT